MRTDLSPPTASELQQLQGSIKYLSIDRPIRSSGIDQAGFQSFEHTGEMLVTVEGSITPLPAHTWVLIAVCDNWYAAIVTALVIGGGMTTMRLYTTEDWRLKPRDLPSSVQALP